MHAKLLFVVILSGFHGLLAVWRKKLVRGESIPTALLKRLPMMQLFFVVLIVLFVVLKPF